MFRRSWRDSRGRRRYRYQGRDSYNFNRHDRLLETRDRYFRYQTFIRRNYTPEQARFRDDTDPSIPLLDPSYGSMGDYLRDVEDRRLALGLDNWHGPEWMYGYLWNMTPDGEDLDEIAANELWYANYRKGIYSFLMKGWAPEST
jgi:hypothetical protein